MKRAKSFIYNASMPIHLRERLRNELPSLNLSGFITDCVESLLNGDFGDKKLLVTLKQENERLHRKLAKIRTLTEEQT